MSEIRILCLLLSGVLVLMTAAIYFQTFKKDSGKFIQYWGFSWFFSLAGHLCLLLLTDAQNSFLFPSLIKSTCDMYTLLFLLFAVYDFMHMPVAIFWLRYSFLLLLFTIVLAQYPLTLDIILIPVSVYQCLLIFSLCWVVITKWMASWSEKALTLMVFLIFGACKVLFAYLSESLYLYEVFFALLLNFCVMFLFLKEVYHDFSQKENEFRLLAENATDIIFDYHLTPSAYFSFISPAVESLTGYPQKDFYSNPNLFEELTVSSDRSSLRELFKAKEEEIQVLQWQKKNGDYIWVEFHNSPICCENNLSSIEGIIRDITERKSVEEELIRSKMAKQVFFSYISHELKTPVTSILGYAKALENDVIEDEKQRDEVLSLIASKTLMLERLIEDLIQLSKLESHQFSFKFTVSPVASFFETMVERLSPRVTASGISFSHNVSPKLTAKAPEFIVDIERMEQVFENLISNAVKFTPPKGKIWISCHLDPSQKKAVFEVGDTGKGIPPESLPFIFEIYYKGKPPGADKPEGSGLGLSIAKEIVKGHQGDIFAQSKENKGSRFIITIPLYMQEN